MSPNLRFVLIAVLVATLSVFAALLLLTLVDHRLDLAGVQHFDFGLQSRIHDLTSPHLTRIMLALTWIGSIKIFAVSLFSVVIFLVLTRRRHAATLLGMAILGAFVLNETLKLHFHRARPHVPWSIGDEHTFSFPSGHSLFSVVLYGTLAHLAFHHATTGFRKAAILIPAVLLPLGIGTSRIYLGMHYPTDVAAGFLTGGLWLSAVVLIDEAWHARVLSAPAAQPDSAQPSERRT